MLALHLVVMIKTLRRHERFLVRCSEKVSNWLSDGQVIFPGRISFVLRFQVRFRALVLFTHS